MYIAQKLCKKGDNKFDLKNVQCKGKQTSNLNNYIKTECRMFLNH